MNSTGLLVQLRDAILSAVYGNSALKDLIDAAKAVIDSNYTITRALGSRQFNSMTTVPSAADPITLTGDNAVAWADGAWVELIADIGAGTWVVDSADISNISAPDDFELDIGVGALAAEARIGTVSFNTEGQHRVPCTPIVRADDPVRVAARIRSKVATPKTADVKLNIIPRS